MNEKLLQYQKILRLAVIAVALLCLVFAGLYFFGYGTLKTNLDPGQTLYINGHKASGSSLKLRPATYKVTVLSARYNSVHQTVTVRPFLTTNFSPKLTARSLDSIAGAALGSFGLYGPPGITKTKWFNGDEWLAGIVGPGSLAPVALHYTNDTWGVAYSTSTGYPSNLSDIPKDVGTYLSTLQSREVQQ